ncbi:MAG: ABC transporter ATP-binding protein [Acidimicrobiales bacterium]
MPLLEVSDVSVSFGGVQALTGVDLSVDRGQITGLIGPNGAGKTTLFNIICGLQVADGGRVVLDGVDISRIKPHKRARLGIARTFQRLEVFGSMSVRDNIRVAVDVHRGWATEASPPAETTEQILDRVGLRDVASVLVSSLPTGLARLVEVGRCLASKPHVVLFDEPSSGLSGEETTRFAHLLRSLVDDGLAILLVEHDVELVMGICTQIHVLDFGKIIALGAPDEIQQSHQVRQAYLGTL